MGGPENGLAAKAQLNVPKSGEEGRGESATHHGTPRGERHGGGRQSEGQTTEYMQQDEASKDPDKGHTGVQAQPERPKIQKIP